MRSSFHLASVSACMSWGAIYPLREDGQAVRIYGMKTAGPKQRARLQEHPLLPEQLRATACWWRIRKGFLRIASEVVSRAQFQSRRELEYYVFGGGSPRK